MNYQKKLAGSAATLMIVLGGALVLVAVIGIVIQKNRSLQNSSISEINQTKKQAVPTMEIVVNTVTPTMIQTTLTDTTDTKLTADTAKIDETMKAISSDAATIDEGLNDQMGDLSE